MEELHVIAAHTVHIFPVSGMMSVICCDFFFILF
jgi:hypothetical protein